MFATHPLTFFPCAVLPLSKGLMRTPGSNARIILCVLLLALITPSQIFAVDNSNPVPKTEHETELERLNKQQPTLEQNLQTITDKLKQDQWATGTFVQTRLLPNQTSLSSSGQFMYLRPAGIYWETNSPVFLANTFETEKTTQWQSPGHIATQQNSNPAVERTGKLIMQILQGDFETLQKHFQLSSSINENGQWSLVLEPQSSAVKKSLHSISLSGNNNLDQISLNTHTQGSTQITLSTEHTQAELPGKLPCSLFPYASENQLKSFCFEQ